MTIRFLLMNAYGVGGTIRATFTMAAELAKRHDVEIVSLERTSERPMLTLDPGVRLSNLTDSRDEPRGFEAWARSKPSRIWHPGDNRFEEFSLYHDTKLMRFLLSVRDGVLIGTRPALNIAIARFAPASAVRVGQDHMHLRRYSPELRGAMRETYPQLDALVALTKRTAAGYRRMTRERTRVETIPNGVRELDGLRAPLENKVVAAAGRLTYQKGFERLLPVWAKVAADHPGWELRIYGEGPRRERLERDIRALGIEGSAKLMGHTPKLPEKLAQASLFAMTSRFEGFPMVLLEAMSIGLPVLAYDINTGPSDIVTNGVDGYVLPKKNVDAMARAMSELMDDPARRQAFGAAALEKAAQYDPARIAARFEKLLTELDEVKQKERRPRVRDALAYAAERPGVANTVERLTGHRLVKPEEIPPARKRRPAKKRRAALPDHYDAEARETIAAVRQRTMTSHEKLFALIEATRYVVAQGVPGDIVECGVWRGGSMQAVARTLLANGAGDRDLHLFDTFEGMPEPSEKDRRVDGAPAAQLLATKPRESKLWAIASLEDVQAGMAETGYPAERVHFHPGLVEDTIPEEAPERIALLRLDTDWYESTRHELEHLYERVPSGGVILLDDYGYWEGAREAVDEFVGGTGVRLLLVPMGSGRITVKP